MNSKKVLVTGGTGYIGSHTTVELIQAGFDVLIIDNLSNSDIDVLDRIEHIAGTRPVFESFNLCDKTKLKTFLDQHSDIHAIIHFAAFKAVGESVSNPLAYYQNNLVSLINLLELMPQYDIEAFVFSSSCTVYGQPDVLPVTEQAPIQKAASPYGNTKQICEEVLQDSIRGKSSLKAISLRYFNPIGAHDSALIGELPRGTPNNLVPYITQTAAGVREKLYVYGNDYNTPDGSCIRDYIHVVDLAKAHVLAAKRLLDHTSQASFEFFNLGTGQGHSVLEVIQAFETVSNSKLNYEIAPRRPGDIESIYADTHLANQTLNWKAEKDLHDMVRSAWAWEQNYRKQNQQKNASSPPSA